jgi:uncharacterized protein (DUF1684 family)
VKENQASSKKLLTQLESENQTHSERANAANKLCEGWLKENKLLLLRGLPQLTLIKYKESVNYQTDDSLVFLAGADDAWLKGHHERTKQREQENTAYHAGQQITLWMKLGEFTRIVAIGILLSLLIGFIFILLY